MAYQRSNRFPQQQLSLAAWARAFGHPGRIALLEALAGRSSCTCGELVEGLPLAQATVSQHLNVLKEAGLITGTIDGPRTCYCIDRDAVQEAGEAFVRWFQSIEDLATCCRPADPEG